MNLISLLAVPVMLRLLYLLFIILSEMLIHVALKSICFSIKNE